MIIIVHQEGRTKSEGLVEGGEDSAGGDSIPPPEGDALERLVGVDAGFRDGIHQLVVLLLGGRVLALTVDLAVGGCSSMGMCQLLHVMSNDAQDMVCLVCVSGLC